jgi:Tol biopolymer transport system component
LSGDGSCAVFAAPDGGLVASDNNNASDVFWWDGSAGTNELISVHQAQAFMQSGNAMSSLGAASLNGDGRLVAFASFASDLVPNDFNQDCDVFVRDLTSGSNFLASAGLDGNPGLGGGSYSPVISANGRYVVFISGATNLVAGDTNRTSDVFRRDLETGMTVLVSANSEGVSLGAYDCSIAVCSQDGRYVAFLCRTNASTAITNLFWRDMSSGITHSVSGSAHPSQPVSLSANGQRLAYFSSSSWLCVWSASSLSNIYANTDVGLTSAAISPAGNRVLYQAASQLFVYDLAGASNLFLCPSLVPINSASQWSGDERYVAFVTATNLLASDNNGTNDVYLRDMQTGTVTLVSVNQNGSASAAGPSDSPVVSTDGRFVAFRSFAADIAPGIVKPPSLVVFDRLAGTNSLLATGSTANPWTTKVFQPAFSADGSGLAFQSWDVGPAAGDLNRAGDVFASDLSGWAALDSDGDGISDWWMIEYFTHATGLAGDRSRAQDDADGDGMNNLGEFIAGTIPTDAGSVLAVRAALDASGTNIVVGWDAVVGKNYQVLSAGDLGNPVWLVVAGNVGAFGSLRYFNIPATNEHLYFRIKCGD